jgi:hypothetical protein
MRHDEFPLIVPWPVASARSRSVVGVNGMAILAVSINHNKKRLPSKWLLLKIRVFKLFAEARTR